MKILFLGPSGTPQQDLADFLLCDGNNVKFAEKKLVRIEERFDLLISYGYRYKLPANILDQFGANAINLHISFLPWNRGADPNLWSILENTPKGVTIHRMHKNIDCGEIIYQKKIFFSCDDTLRTSYEKLHTNICDLFKSNWDDIKNKKTIPKKQQGLGSYHNSSDKKPYMDLLVSGWDTKITDLKGKAINA